MIYDLRIILSEFKGLLNGIFWSENTFFSRNLLQFYAKFELNLVLNSRKFVDPTLKLFNKRAEVDRFLNLRVGSTNYQDSKTLFLPQSPCYIKLKLFNKRAEVDKFLNLRLM